jgi:hypothetical protein
MNRRNFLGAFAGVAVAPKGEIIRAAPAHEFSWRSVPNQLVEIGIWRGFDKGGRCWVSTTLGRCYVLEDRFHIIDCALTDAERPFRHDHQDDAAKERAYERLLHGIRHGEESR